MRTYFVILATVAFSTATHAKTEASSGVQISLVVPEFCQIESSAITVDPNGLSMSGSVLEMCNSGLGFRIMASHRMLDENETAQISYAGQIRQLDSSGMSNVALRNGPTFGNVPVVVQARGLMRNLTISLGVTMI